MTLKIFFYYYSWYPWKIQKMLRYEGHTRRFHSNCIDFFLVLYKRASSKGCNTLYCLVGLRAYFPVLQTLSGRLERGGLKGHPGSARRLDTGRLQLASNHQPDNGCPEPARMRQTKTEKQTAWWLSPLLSNANSWGKEKGGGEREKRKKYVKSFYF